MKSTRRAVLRVNAPARARGYDFVAAHVAGRRLRRRGSGVASRTCTNGRTRFYPAKSGDPRTSSRDVAIVSIRKLAKLLKCPRIYKRGFRRLVVMKPRELEAFTPQSAKRKYETPRIILTPPKTAAEFLPERQSTRKRNVDSAQTNRLIDDNETMS